MVVMMHDLHLCIRHIVGWLGFSFVVGLQNMPSSPSAGNQWAQLNQNTWPSTGGSSEQASLQAQAQALALQLSLSGNLDQVYCL